MAKQPTWEEPVPFAKPKAPTKAELATAVDHLLKEVRRLDQMLQSLERDLRHKKK